MNELIQALIIFLKYKNEDYPTVCEHDVLIIVGVPKGMTEEETQTPSRTWGSTGPITTALGCPPSSDPHEDQDRDSSQDHQETC